MKKHVTAIIVFLSICVLAGAAGKNRVSGTVVDAVTKTPVEGAEVFVKEGRVRLTAGKKGDFSFETESPAVTITVRAPGYSPAELRTAAPNEKAVIELDISAEFTLGRVYVKDKYKIEGSKQKVRSEQINRTTAQLFPDTLKVIQTLPGVVTGNDMSSLMYVRGGDFYETISFLDNIYILSPYMWGGIQSIFNPAFVDKVDFYSGGFPAKYPQALSAVVDIKNREGDFEKRKGYVELSATTFEFLGEGPMTKGRSSYIVGIRRTYYDLFANLILGGKYSGIVFPFFYDAQAKFVWKVSDDDKVYFDLIASHEGMDFNSAAVRDNAEDAGRDFEFHYNDTRVLPAFNWERVISPELSNGFTFSVRYEGGSSSFLNDDVKSVSNRDQYDVFVKDRANYRLGANNFEAGMYFFRTYINAIVRADFRTLMPNGTYFYDFRKEEFDWTRINIYGAYLQDDIALVQDKLFLNAGGLIDRFDYTDNTTFSPRGGVKYCLTDDTTFKFNTGLYSQFPVHTGGGIPPFIYNESIKSERAVHYVLGFEQELPGQFFLRVEAYRKNYFDRVVSDPDPALDYTNNGERKAQGLDVFLQKKIGGRWDGWLSYSYLDAKDLITARGDPSIFPGKSSLDYPAPIGEWYEFSEDRTHNLSVSVNYDFNKKYQLAVTYRYATGQPYTAVTGVVSNNGVYAPVYGQYLAERMPDYSRLDVKLTMPFKRLKNTDFFVQVINLLGTNNIDRYYYNSDFSKRYEAQMLPLMPIVGLRYNF